MNGFGLYTEGFKLVFGDPQVLLLLVVGSICGIVIGALPGLTAVMAVAIMTPLTYTISPQAAMALLLGAYTAAVFGGSIGAILLKIPGTPAAVMTVLDGYPMNERGEAGRAIGIAIVSSFIGGLFSVVVLTLFSPIIAEMALKFGPQEYFALAILGLSVIAYISPGSMVKGFISGALGLLISTIGMESSIGFGRYTFGSIDLLTGVQMVPVMIGMFGFSEMLSMSEQINIEIKRVSSKLGRILPTFKELRDLMPTISRQSVVGVIVGAIPAAGATIASILSYGLEKRISKRGNEFGTGVPEGIAAAESSNNACTGGAMIPMLSLGIPGDAVTAVLIGALMLHGLTPGPMLFQEHLDVVSSIFILILLGNVAFLIFGIGAAKVFPYIGLIPYKYLTSMLLALTTVGAFAIRNSVFDVGVLLVSGVIGYFLVKCKVPVAPLILGLVLGDIVENNLIRSLILSDGNWFTFFSRPISGFIMVVSILITASPYLAQLFTGKAVRKTENIEDEV